MSNKQNPMTDEELAAIQGRLDAITPNGVDCAGCPERRYRDKK